MEEKEIHLRDYFRVLLRRRYTAYAFFLAVFIITVLLTVSATPVYMASTKILIQKNEPSNLTAMNGYYYSYDPDFYETQYQLIRSTSVAQKVVKTLSLDKAYAAYFKHEGPDRGISGWFKQLFSTVLRVAGIDRQKPGAASAKDTDEALQARADAFAKMISGSIIVTPIKNTKLLNIGYMSKNPELAALIANSVAKAYIDDMLEMRMVSSKNAMRWMAEKADEERARLEKSETALQEYMRHNDIVTLENKVALLPEKLAGIAGKLSEAETHRRELEALYARVKDIAQDIGRADAIPAIASDPTIQSVRGQIISAEQNVADLSKKYGQKHPAMIAAIENLNALKGKKEQEIRRMIESIRNQYELARTNEESFRKMGSQVKVETLNLGERFVQYEALKRENEANKQLFDLIVKKMKEQDITQDIKTVDVWVVEKAEVPSSPARPRKLFNILVGLFIGLLGGAGLAFFVEYLDNTVKSPEDVEARLGTPVLGMVRLLESGEKPIEHEVLKEPRSDIAENYKSIRTAVLLSSAVTPPRNLLITSISPGEGKTATAVNLAVTIAQSEHSVLLIDADLRRARVHKIFGLENSKGLSTYLAGASDLVIHSAGVGNLSILTSGPLPPNPSELLSSARMNDLLKTLNEKFDIVIWDSAPLLSVTDSLILSKVLDGTIIVTRAGISTYDGVRRGLKSLQDIEAHFLGIIINAVDAKKSGYYYGYYYNYYSGEKS